MKRKLKPFFEKLGSPVNSEFVLIPTIGYYYFPKDKFTRPNSPDWVLVVEFKFLFWCVGIECYKEVKSNNISESIISGDEPFSGHVTSVPEKQIGD